MSRSGAVIVHEDAEVLAGAVAARLVNRLADAQAQRGEASIVLTGGRIAAQVYEHVLESPIRGVVDWTKVDFWWGDERFLPSGDPERNETQARSAFLDKLLVDPERVHPIPAADVVDTPEEAAALYAAELETAASATLASRRLEQHGDGVPMFDLLLLGIGEDGHVASLFPGNPALEAEGAVTAVHDSPKPPPDRVSLTLGAINTATAAWIIASGSGKAAAVEESLSPSAKPANRRLAASATLASRQLEERELPAGCVKAVGHTRWLIDKDAAERLKHFEF